MVTGIIGKVGMTQLFAADGTVQPATVLQAGPCVVSQVKTWTASRYEAARLRRCATEPRKQGVRKGTSRRRVCHPRIRRKCGSNAAAIR